MYLESLIQDLASLWWGIMTACSSLIAMMYMSVTKKVLLSSKWIYISMPYIYWSIWSCGRWNFNIYITCLIDIVHLKRFWSLYMEYFWGKVTFIYWNDMRQYVRFHTCINLWWTLIITLPVWHCIAPLFLPLVYN